MSFRLYTFRGYTEVATRVEALSESRELIKEIASVGYRRSYWWCVIVWPSLNMRRLVSTSDCIQFTFSPWLKGTFPYDTNR